MNVNPARKLDPKQHGKNLAKLIPTGLFLSCLCLLSSCQDKPPEPKTAPIASDKPTTSASPTATPKEAQGTLERVKARGKLICGVNGKLPGFSYVNEKGEWSGLDVDYCRAIAAAVLGNDKAIEYKTIAAKDRFTALKAGDIDVLLRNTARTLSRDATKNIAFAPTVFFDGQGIMLRVGTAPNNATPKPTSSKPSSEKSSTEDTQSTEKTTEKSTDKSDDSASKDLPTLKDLAGKTICVETGNSESNLKEALKEANVQADLVTLADLDSIYNSYVKGNCVAVSLEKSQLAAWRSKFPKPSDHKILDASFSKEPLSYAVLSTDKRWQDIVTWVVYATFYAEELGINQKNYTVFKDTKNPDVSRFLGTSESLGIELGLDPDWTTQVLKAVGNYEDIYNRNLTTLGLPRGINQNWKQGGLLYSMPFR
ncbi:amino acid ABC transporter substrate-binding protein [Tumidithrix elongata RA019]|uniref:Amino acid ABC transporter substrate-binding protein n=1 Tax=Tumidithrix elongata BACA0141 TaxID=2716417 RepID=A0AAW9PXB1_9CYAN|nr:amino acid ABC transporter substrate-binding protein [Tumidithrix elongata RA019]